MFMMQPTNKTNLESQLVAKIEEEQLDGKLKLKPVAEDTIRLRLDRHGIQVRERHVLSIISSCEQQLSSHYCDAGHER